MCSFKAADRFGREVAAYGTFRYKPGARGDPNSAERRSLLTAFRHFILEVTPRQDTTRWRVALPPFRYGIMMRP
jgi:hypothetical protein